MKKPKKFKNPPVDKLIVLSLAVVSVLLVVSVLSLNSVRGDNTKLENEISSVENLMNQEPGVLGRSCGILSPTTAKKILNTDLLSQKYTNEPKNNELSNNIHWSDSCRFVNIESSDSYVELFIETYKNKEDALFEYNNTLPKVGTISETASGQFDKINYSGGAWFALNEEVIIKVSASSGGKGNIKEFSSDIFWQLVDEL